MKELLRFPPWLDLRIFSLVLLMSFNFGFSQDEIEVSGVVTSAKDKMPLPSVNIAVKNSAAGTLTDFDGNYTITIAEDAVLVFSSIGFKTLEEPIDGRSEINVSLTEDVGDLDEVVITGYTSQEKKSITGAISTVTSEDLEKVKGGGTVSSGLAGKIPGVSFRMPDGRPGASATIQIRNMGTPL